MIACQRRIDETWHGQMIRADGREKRVAVRSLAIEGLKVVYG